MSETAGSYSASAILWGSWGMTTVVSSVEAVLGILTFNSLSRVRLSFENERIVQRSNRLSQLVYKAVPVEHYRRVLQGTMAASLMAPILIMGLNIVSLFVLFYKTWRHSGTGFAYGFVNASFLHQGIFLLLSSVVLLSDRDFLHELAELGKLWSSIDSTLYTFCYYTGFVAAGFYLAQFLLLLCVQSAVRQHHRKHRQWPEASQSALLGSEPGTPSVPGTPRGNPSLSSA